MKLIIGMIITMVILAVSGYLYKKAMKGHLTKTLGREIEDHEITSLSTWLEATPEAEKSYKEYVPAKNQRPKTEDQNPPATNH